MFNLPNVGSKSGVLATTGEAVIMEEEGEIMIMSTSMSAEKEKRTELFVEYGLEVLLEWEHGGVGFTGKV